MQHLYQKSFAGSKYRTRDIKEIEVHKMGFRRGQTCSIASPKETFKKIKIYIRK